MTSTPPKVLAPILLADRTASLARLKDGNSRLLREDIGARRPRFRALPEVVGLHNSDLCNMRCPMCPRSVRQGERKLASRAVADVCAELFPTARKASLSGAAGEPLLADFDLIRDAALEWDVRLDLVTNGSFLDQETYRSARVAFDHVNVSLDSHLAETHAILRAGGRFERIVENLESIRDLRRAEPDGVLLSVSFLETVHNLPHLPDFLRFAAELEVDGVICQGLRHDVHAARALDIAGSSLEVERIYVEARAVAVEVGVNLLLHEVGRPSELVRPFRDKLPVTLEGRGLCWFLAQYLGVQPNGDLYPCCFPTDHRLGNLFDDDVREVWNGEPVRRLREAHFAGSGSLFCRGCMHAPHLTGSRPAGLVATARKLRQGVNHGLGKLAERRRDSERGSRPMRTGRVIYLCNWTGHSGGIKVLYDHVWGLRKLGVDAWLGAYGEFEAATWFQPHDPAVPALSNLLGQLGPDDLLVLPEITMWDQEPVGQPCRQVVFVQNPDLMTAAADDPRFCAMLVVSACLRPVLRDERHYRGDLHVVHAFLEQRLVAPPRGFTSGRPRILIVDRQDKNRGEPKLTQEALEALGFQVTRLTDSVSRAEFVQRFSEHDVYLHLSYREGFPISVLEAFGAGALVVGWAGRGGLEFMRDGVNCWVFEDGDWRAVVDRVVALESLGSERLTAMLTEARATALEHDEASFLDGLAEAYSGLLRRPLARPGAARGSRP